MKVYAIPEIIEYLETLVDILYEKEYFSYQQTSEIYVAELFNDIITNLPKKQHKPAPKYYDRYGKELYYAAFTKNKRTTWYAFFSKYEENGNIWFAICVRGDGGASGGTEEVDGKSCQLPPSPRTD